MQHAARFDVVVLAFRADAGVHPSAALQLALKMPPSTARLLTERLPCVVLSAIPEEHAARVRKDLERYGAVVELRGSSLGRISQGQRSSDGVRATGSQPSREDYELGEILAPLGQSHRPAKKPALSLPPPVPGTHASLARGAAPLQIETRTSTGPSAPTSAPFGGRRPLHSLFDDDAPLQLAIELPSRTRAGARPPMVVGELPKPEARESTHVRFKRWALRGMGEVGPILLHGVLFVVISAVSLTAVSWALRAPDKAASAPAAQASSSR